MTYNSSSLIQTYRFNNPGGAAYFGDPVGHVLDNYNFRELKTEEYVLHHKLAYAFNAKGEHGPLGFETGADWKRLDRRVNNDRWNYANPTFRLASAQRILAYTPPARREPLLFLDDAVWDRLFANGSGAGFTLTQPSSFEQSAEGDFEYIEDISAGYLMGTWQTARATRTSMRRRRPSADSSRRCRMCLFPPTFRPVTTTSCPPQTPATN